MRVATRSRSRVVTAIPDLVGDRFLIELQQLIREMAVKGGGFKATYQASEMMSKFVTEDHTPADERRGRAIRKWLDTERRNSRTNPRLQLGLSFEKDFGWATWDRIRSDCRLLIERVLGPLEYPSVIQDGVHTNGASTRVRKSPSAALFKLSGESHISNSAIKHWLAAFSGTRISSQTLSICESSVLFTVPKKSDIDRVAAKEPECNMLLQRSVGNHIRRRLKIFGIDLKDQTVNQQLARVAVDKGLATVDLSSASDSITRQLVLELLPWEWYSLLDDLRVKSVVIPGEDGHPDHGEIHEFEMFSSMGNGFTFELESLIFYAVTRVVSKISSISGRISIYGDDIICPVGIIPRLTNVFGFLGFKLNPEKTHDSGFFRESCGAHWWKGFDVKPFYIRRAVRELPDLINHLNHLLEWDGRGWGFFITEEAYHFWEKWKSYVPEFLWGGIDPSDPSALVTGHSPRKRLVPKTRDAPRPPQAGLDYWLLARDRHQDPIKDYHVAGRLTDRSLDEAHMVVDPRIQVGYLSRPVISRGVRTTWSPGIAFCDPVPSGEAVTLR